MATKVIEGLYTNALVYMVNEDGIEKYAEEQIKQLCNLPWLADTKIVIMPDVHPGKVSTIGFTMSGFKYMMPALIGNDIGCGVLAVKLTKKTRKIDFLQLDKFITQNIPSGTKKSNNTKLFDKYLGNTYYNYDDLSDTIKCSFGSLGGGNHFIEIDKCDDDTYILVIHTGSRSFGAYLYEKYMDKASKFCKENGITDVYELSYLNKEDTVYYLDDVKKACLFAENNRQAIADMITDYMGWKVEYWLDTPHNYIDNYDVLRKGAISARRGNLVIPINGRDGIIIGEGLEKESWNWSAPHGAGRLFSRSEVKNHFTTNQYKKEMAKVYSSTVGSNTLDECPMAYRSIEDIKEVVQDTIKIKHIATPVYNFKGGSK